MPLLYDIIRSALGSALGLYYVDIQATGQEHIPSDGPLIFAANHPNSIMDTVILGTQTQRTISFLARSGLFKNPAVRFVFNHFGVIPVYRAQDDPSQLHRNKSSFDRAYDCLAEGGCLGIFPEGKNSHERAVRELKTGTARIALGAEAARDYKIGLKIVPVGLNFENRDRFLTSVLIRFGPPICVSDWAEAHAADDRRAVLDLTETLQERLRVEATHIECEVVLALTRDVWDIYGKKLIKEMLGDWKVTRTMGGRFMDELRATPETRADLDDKFWAKQRIADAINHFTETDPKLVEKIRSRVRKYKDHLAQVQLHHSLLERGPHDLSLRKESLRFTLYAICFAPVALYGLTFNIIPYLLTRLISLTAPDEPIRAIRGFSAGLVLYPLFYAMLAFGLWTASGHSILWTSIFVLSLPPSGFFSLRYHRQLMKYRDRIITRTLFLTDGFLVQRLSVERLKILSILSDLKERFIAETSSELEAHLDRKSGQGPDVAP